MKTMIFPMIRRTGLLSGALLVCASAPVRAAEKAPADALPNFESYIKISGQAPSISGNDAAFQARARQSSNGGVGIEDLHVLKDVTKKTTLVIDGKALVGSEDYLGRFNVTTAKVGSIDVGYKRFRTFYDGVGGFFPLNRQWMPLTNQDLHVDRSKFWFEGNLALPDAPVFTLRYTNETRTGRKDSTIWGDTDFTGLPNNVSPISQVRKIVPSYIDIGERHERLEVSMKHTIKKTTLQLSLFGDRTDNSNTRSVVRFPGEARPFPTPPATLLVPAQNMNNQVIIAENDAMKTQTTGATAESITVLTDKITLRVGGNYHLIHTTISGGRPLITSTPTATGVVPVTTDNYASLAGGTRLKTYIGNVALDFQPTKTLFVKLALRAQSEFIRGAATFNVIAASGTPALTLATTPRIGWSKLHQNVQTPVVEVRYTGVKNLAIYFNGSKRNLNGDERNTSAYNPITAVLGTPAIQHVSEDHGNYTLGANWKTSPQLTLRAEVFQKGHKTNTVGFDTRIGDYYLLDSQYSGYKLTALAKPSNQFGSTTRFIEQRGKMQVTGFLPTYPAYDSLNAKNYMLSETLDFTPNTQCYFQVAGTLVYNVISTVYPRAGVTNATATAIAFDSNKVLQNANHNYSTITFLTGFVVDRKTDAQLQVNTYRADNDNSNLAPLTQPYGVAVREVTATLGLKRKMSDKWIGHAKIGYFESTNDTTGGNTNFRGPLAYLAFEHAL